MFKAARHVRIKEVLMERGHIDVSTLSSLLNVSEVTIRSDLEQLEKDNFVRRTHGGAILNEDYLHSNVENPLLVDSSNEYIREKEYIAEIATDLVSNSNWIFLGQGTTCYYVAKALAKKQSVNIVTNNLSVAAAFSLNKNAQVLVTGGSLVHSHMYLAGDLFIRTVEDLHFSYAFVGVAGISIENGITVQDSSEVFILKKLREISNEVIVVADFSKFGKTSFMKIGRMNYPNSIITNESIPEIYKAFCYDNGIQLFTSYRIPSIVVTGNIGKDD